MRALEPQGCWPRCADCKGASADRGSSAEGRSKGEVHSKEGADGCARHLLCCAVPPLFKLRGSVGEQRTTHRGRTAAGLRCRTDKAQQ